MFVTVNELVGLPGLPGTAQGVRYTLNKCAAGLPEMMRRREGTKAFEYHIDCLPDAAREAVQARIARELQVESGEGLPAVAEAGGAVAKGSAETCVDLELYRKCPAGRVRQGGVNSVLAFRSGNVPVMR